MDRNTFHCTWLFCMCMLNTSFCFRYNNVIFLKPYLMEIQATCMYCLVVKTGVQVCASIIPLFAPFSHLSFFCSCHMRMVITHQEAEVFPVGVMTSETKRSNMLHYMRLLFSLLSSSTLFFTVFPLFHR